MIEKCLKKSRCYSFFPFILICDNLLNANTQFLINGWKTFISFNILFSALIKFDFTSPSVNSNFISKILKIQKDMHEQKKSIELLMFFT